MRDGLILNWIKNSNMGKNAGNHGKRSYQSLWTMLKMSFAELKKNNPLRMSGATAFFTTFALPPILLILFQLFSLFLNKRLLGREMMELITSTFGKDGAEQVLRTARGFYQLASRWWIAAGGFLFLVFVATTLFGVIKNSLNDIWKIGVKERPGFLFSLRLRARSLGVILVAGILFLAGILLDSFELIAGKYMEEQWSNMGKYFSGALNEIVSAVIVTAWFVVLFRYLADGRPSWRVAMAGGVLTGLLFSIGKEILSILMSNSNLTTIYGTSGSIVLILLFVFYSSFILYFGAAFVKVYSESIGDLPKLINKAYRYKVQAIAETTA